LSCQENCPDTITVLTLRRKFRRAKGAAALRPDWLRGNGNAARLGFDQRQICPIAVSKITVIGNGE
jgi:hypothetical protein